MKCAQGYKVKDGRCVSENSNSKKSKTTKGFDSSLTYTSLFGFFVIALNSFTSFNLSPWTTTAFMILAGAGLMAEGRVTTIRQWSKDGIQGSEVAYLFTIVFGLFMIITGILAMPSINIINDSLNTIIGLSSIFSIVFISAQKWVFN